MKIFGQHSLASKTSVGLKVLFGLCLCFLLFGAYYLSKTFGCILFSFPVEESPAFIFLCCMLYLSGIVCLVILWHLIQVFGSLKKEEYFSFLNVSHLNWSAIGMGIVSAIYLSVTLVSICTVDDLMESAVALFILAAITVASCLGAIGVKVFSSIYQYLLQMIQPQSQP
ncbi:hypothetical protein BN3661_00972 [Eubacteriaceae bacterium CHKCI005]|uniref:DUF2975 domain-containing protein n=1 Tax=Solibaculum mannosilyticum TaxID=2780922 RepID=A0A7I8CZM7_9FIRM|nr:DUF2975 domain-containing protein [Solibaculum mannosilyticum]BCI59960.1 hypothetical protein C12CBH8_05990 [Solibaculum mannosilyticum]CZT55879.1 hypothetical protein BN3661_00972 [Eubacteriaceae bacterium CHKCI005]